MGRIMLTALSLLMGGTRLADDPWMIEHAVDLVIFDCDGVLIDSEVISTRMTIERLAALGYDVSEPDANRRFVGRSYRSMRSDVEADWGQKLPPSFEADLEQATVEAMAKALQPVRGVSAMLSALKRPRCVASSSSVDWIKQGLTLTGLIHHLDPYLFSASMVENGKPAPDLFLHAAAEMGSTPELSLVIEDSVPGVEAGVAAGMTVIGFTGGSHAGHPAHAERLRDVGAKHVIPDITMLQSLLQDDR